LKQRPCYCELNVSTVIVWRKLKSIYSFFSAVVMGKQTTWPGIFLALKFPYLCKFIQAYKVSLYCVFLKKFVILWICLISALSVKFLRAWNDKEQRHSFRSLTKPVVFLFVVNLKLYSLDFIENFLQLVDTKELM